MDNQNAGLLASNYIERRFPDSSENYWEIWYRRFANGAEWQYSDLEGRRILQELAPTYYPDDINESQIIVDKN